MINLPLKLITDIEINDIIKNNNLSYSTLINYIKTLIKGTPPYNNFIIKLSYFNLFCFAYACSLEWYINLDNVSIKKIMCNVNKLWFVNTNEGRISLCIESFIADYFSRIKFNGNFTLMDALCGRGISNNVQLESKNDDLVLAESETTTVNPGDKPSVNPGDNSNDDAKIEKINEICESMDHTNPFSTQLEDITEKLKEYCHKFNTFDIIDHIDKIKGQMAEKNRLKTLIRDLTMDKVKALPSTPLKGGDVNQGFINCLSQIHEHYKFEEGRDSMKKLYNDLVKEHYFTDAGVDPSLHFDDKQYVIKPSLLGLSNLTFGAYISTN